MTGAVVTTGLTGNTYKTLFRNQIRRVRPPVVGMAVAYVSASGFSLVKRILDDGGVREVRLVTDAKDGVTHPRALQGAVDSGWDVRVVDGLAGTFHPKLYVGAARFDDRTGVAGISLAVAGSPNLSHGGFLKNGECVFWSAAPDICKSTARAWRDCWTAGVPATAERLAAYEKFCRENVSWVGQNNTDRLPGAVPRAFGTLHLRHPSGGLRPVGFPVLGPKSRPRGRYQFSCYGVVSAHANHVRFCSPQSIPKA